MVKKLIIDTDPGIDDAMAILAAFNSRELEVIGLTTIFGNVRTPQATANALILCELADHASVPVAQGCKAALSGLEKERIADFVHGADGFGNSGSRAPKGSADERTAAHFIVDTVLSHPGQVTVLALGPLTNIAMAVRLSKDIVSSMAELIVLGGSFQLNGNVNPAAEANMFGDAEAADFVLGQSGNIRVVGLDATHRCRMSGDDLRSMKGRGRFGTFLCEISQFYLQYHVRAYDMDAIYVHDPTALAAVINPSLFTWQRGEVRVLTDGIAKGMTIMDTHQKQWNGSNAWTGRPQVQVALDVDGAALVQLVLDRMSADGPVV